MDTSTVKFDARAKELADEIRQHIPEGNTSLTFVSNPRETLLILDHGAGGELCHLYSDQWNAIMELHRELLPLLPASKAALREQWDAQSAELHRLFGVTFGVMDDLIVRRLPE